MKLSEYSRINSLSYRTALNLFKGGKIKGVKERWSS